MDTRIRIVSGPNITRYHVSLVIKDEEKFLAGLWHYRHACKELCSELNERIKKHTCGLWHPERNQPKIDNVVLDIDAVIILHVMARVCVGTLDVQYLGVPRNRISVDCGVLNDYRARC